MVTKKLTDKLINCLVLPRQKQEILRDSEIRGFGLRLTPGGMSYIVEARINGKNKRLMIMDNEKRTGGQFNLSC